MIRLSQVSYTYPQSKRPALNNLSLNINKNEFLAIIGRNGSGKSTLARMLNALLLPEKGELCIDGYNSREPQNLMVIRRKVGLLFANPDSQLLSNLVEEEIAFGPENLGLDPNEIRVRVDTALKLVSMEDYAKYPPYLLSGGQKQKVCIASLLAMQPDYLVLDEPFSMLDPPGRKKLLHLILKLREHLKITLVLITNSLEEAILADRICILDKGELIKIVTPAQALNMDGELFQLGIEPLELKKLIIELNKYPGISLDNNITDVESLVDTLCRLA